MKSVDISFRTSVAMIPLTALFLNQAVGLPVLMVLAILVVCSNAYFSWGVHTLYPINKATPSPTTETEYILSQLEPTKRAPIVLPYVIAIMVNIVAAIFVLRANIVDGNDGILVVASIFTGITTTLLLVLLHRLVLIASIIFFFLGAPAWIYLLVT